MMHLKICFQISESYITNKLNLFLHLNKKTAYVADGGKLSLNANFISPLGR